MNIIYYKSILMIFEETLDDNLNKNVKTFLIMELKKVLKILNLIIMRSLKYNVNKHSKRIN